VSRGIDLDKLRIRQDGCKSFGVFEAHCTVVSGSQNQHGLRDVSTDIGRCAKVNKKAATRPALQQELCDLGYVVTEPVYRHLTVQGGEIRNDSWKMLGRVCA